MVLEGPQNLSFTYREDKNIVSYLYLECPLREAPLCMYEWFQRQQCLGGYLSFQDTNVYIQYIPIECLYYLGLIPPSSHFAAYELCFVALVVFVH